MKLRADEASVVETAVRLAIESVMNVLCGVNSARTHELQRVVEDREREIQRLEGRLRDTESELRLLRRQGCTCPAASPSCDPPEGSEERECEVSISLGLLAGPSSQSGLDQTCSSLSSDALSVSAPVPLPHCPAQPSHCPTVQVKEEPADSHEVLLQWDGSTQVSPTDQDQLTHREQWQSVTLEAEDTSVTNQELLRRKNVSMGELSEEAKRLKRAAWRAASKRYYARKVARQQPASAHAPQPFPYPGNRNRKRPIAELPEATQSQQREAWRLASRRYYARKLSQASARVAHAQPSITASYTQPGPAYTQPAPAYTQPAPNYTQPASNYTHSSGLLGDITYS